MCISYTRKGGTLNDQQQKKRVNIYLSADTVERLKQYAFENHTSVSHAITDWIWRTKIKNDQVRGQQHLDI